MGVSQPTRDDADEYTKHSSTEEQVHQWIDEKSSKEQRLPHVVIFRQSNEIGQLEENSQHE